VRRIVTDSYAKTSNLIKENLEALHQLAAALLEKETLDESRSRRSWSA